MTQEEMIEKLDLALQANGSYGKKDWQREMCQCDPDVGMCPCQYCAIFDALTKAKQLLQSSRIVPMESVVLTKEQGQDVSDMLNIYADVLDGSKPRPIIEAIDAQLAAMKGVKECQT